MKKSMCRVLAVLVVALGASVAFAANTNGPVTRAGETGRKAKALGAVTIGGGWETFDWSGAVPVDSSENPFTFTLASPGYLTVTDGFIDGDQFQVYDGVTLIGTTSTPANDGKSGPSADFCYGDPSWSSGSFPLAAGAHSINIVTIAEATGYLDGEGYLRVDYTPYQDPLQLIPTLGWVGLAALVLLLGGAGIFALRRG